MDSYLSLILFAVFVFMIVAYVISYVRKANNHIVKEKLLDQRRKETQEENAKLEKARRKQEKLEREILRKQQELKRKEAYENYFNDKEFINKKTTSLSDFIINDQINTYDLEKLAWLNGICLGTKKGWNALILELLQELHKLGWKGKLNNVKVWWGGLYFSADFPEEIVSDSEHEVRLNEIREVFRLKSLKVCQFCGEPGQPAEDEVGFVETLCELHLGDSEYMEKIIFDALIKSRKGKISNTRYPL